MQAKFPLTLVQTTLFTNAVVLILGCFQKYWSQVVLLLLLLLLKWIYSPMWTFTSLMDFSQ
jgi:hypothetical protein